MASPVLWRSAAQSDLSICPRCAFRASKLSHRTFRRNIGLKYLAKKENAQMAWDQNAEEIRAGRKKSMLTILEERGLVHQMTGKREVVDDLMTSKRVGVYVGFDPTASSLHVGHLLPLMSLYWMFIHGYHAATLLGGATVKIGDPSGRLTSREKTASHVRNANMVNMHYQLKKLWQNVEFHSKRYGYVWEWAWKRELVNNNMWMNKLTVLELLQMLGPGMRMGAMLARDTVKNKMEKGDGMSFAEFTYPLLQAWDWWHMYNTKGVQMQIGGSDQYGNITAGIDAVKYISTNHHDPDVRKEKDVVSDMPFGFTVPLLTTSSGEKFGKSAGNAVWLDRELTSPFDLYGFFMRQADADVERYLKLFTFMPMEDIDVLVKQHFEDPSKRVAQHRLAREVLAVIHGDHEAKATEAQHRLMHGKGSALSTLQLPSEPPLNPKIAPTTLNNAPAFNIKLPMSLITKRSIGKILYAAGLAESASDGHRLAASRSVYIGATPSKKAPMSDGMLTFTPVTNWTNDDTSKFLLDGSLLILRRGKHRVKIINVISDEEWIASGEKFPGQGNWDLSSPPVDEQQQGQKKKSLWQQFAAPRAVEAHK